MRIKIWTYNSWGLSSLPISGFMLAYKVPPFYGHYTAFTGQPGFASTAS